ncbi:MAG: hypothetical protein U1F81_16350 [Verrucomicrobiaceae bacterium]
MNTRVSWIDETHLHSLLERLEAPAVLEEVAESAEIATLPETDAEAPMSFFMEEAAPHPVEALQPVREEFPPLPQTREEPVLQPEASAEPEEAHEEVHDDAPVDTTPVHAEAEAAPPLDRIRERLRMIRHRAAEAGILSHSLPVVEAAAPVVETPEARLAAYARRALEALPAGSLVTILDAEGGILWNNNPKPGLVLSTVMALKAAQHGSIEAIAGRNEVIRQDLPPEHYLTIFYVVSASGQIEVAIKSRLPVGDEMIESWRQTY